jgi:hypothetical protein
MGNGIANFILLSAIQNLQYKATIGSTGVSLPGVPG